MLNSNKSTEQVTEQVPSRSPVKTIALTLGGLFAFAHIGLLGYVIHRPEKPKLLQVPTINIPHGEYSSYTIEAGPDGYKINYKANDPAILESERSLHLDKNKRGWFGGGTEKRDEYRRDQYTINGTRNIGGAAVDSEGKSAKEVECIVADAGSRSQGALAGASIATGAVAPMLVSIPYIGWLASGWAVLLGQRIGSSIGSEVGSVFNDC